MDYEDKEIYKIIGLFVCFIFFLFLCAMYQGKKVKNSIPEMMARGQAQMQEKALLQGQ